MTQKKAKDARVQEILAAAEDEFLEKGFELATMDSIAKRAGLSKGALYHYFAGKDDMLVAANQGYYEAMEPLFASAMAMKSASKALRYYVKAYMSYWDANQRQVEFMFLTMTKALADERIWPLYRDYGAKVRAFLTELFRRGVVAGEFVAHDSEASAICLMGALDGLLGYMVMDKSLSLKKVLASINERFVDSISVPRSAHG
jgi:AcrR family transcriptional regulator